MLKRYKGFLDTEYGPEVTSVVFLYPPMYSEHHNRPNDAIPTKIQPIKKKRLLTNEILSHALEEKMIMISKMTAMMRVMGRRILSKIECDDIDITPFCLCRTYIIQQLIAKLVRGNKACEP
jgi:hypothetical protein